jgi:hypothetical protein
VQGAAGKIARDGLNTGGLTRRPLKLGGKGNSRQRVVPLLVIPADLENPSILDPVGSQDSDPGPAHRPSLEGMNTPALECAGAANSATVAYEPAAEAAAAHYTPACRD